MKWEKPEPLTREWDEYMEIKARHWFANAYRHALLLNPQQLHYENDADRQRRGVDINLKGYGPTDEKCGLHYFSQDVNNICIELERAYNVPGWFLHPYSLTEYYSFMIPRAESLEDLEAERLTSFRWMLISKKVLKEYIEQKTGKTAQQIRDEHTGQRSYISNGIRVVRSPLPSRPLVLLVPIKALIPICEAFVYMYKEGNDIRYEIKKKGGEGIEAERN